MQHSSLKRVMILGGLLIALAASSPAQGPLGIFGNRSGNSNSAENKRRPDLANLVHSITYEQADGEEETRFFTLDKSSKKTRLIEVTEPGGSEIEFNDENESAVDTLQWALKEIGFQEVKKKNSESSKEKRGFGARFSVSAKGPDGATYELKPPSKSSADQKPAEGPNGEKFVPAELLAPGEDDEYEVILTRDEEGKITRPGEE